MTVKTIIERLENEVFVDICHKEDNKELTGYATIFYGKAIDVYEHRLTRLNDSWNEIVRHMFVYVDTLNNRPVLAIVIDKPW